MCAKSHQSHWTHCDPVDCSPPESPWLLCPRYSPDKNTGVPCPPPGDLPDPGIEPCLFTSLHWQAGSLPLAPSGYYGHSKFYTTLERNNILVERKNGVGVMGVSMLKFRAEEPNILINSGIPQTLKSPGLFLVEYKNEDKQGLRAKKQTWVWLLTLQVVRFPGGYFQCSQYQATACRNHSRKEHTDHAHGALRPWNTSRPHGIRVNAFISVCLLTWFPLVSCDDEVGDNVEYGKNKETDLKQKNVTHLLFLHTFLSKTK